VEVPISTDPIWVTIDMKKTTLGKLVELLYRPPPIRLYLAQSGDETVRCRLIPDVAAGGFLLSPVIRQTSQIVGLYSVDWKNALRNSFATSIALSDDDGNAPTWAYEDPVKVTFYALEFPHTNISKSSSGLSGSGN
jgi:hypothetical protein